MENNSIIQEQPQNTSVFLKTFILFAVPFVLYPTGGRVIGNDWSDWKMVLASAAIGIGLAIIPGTVLAFALQAFASHDRRRGLTFFFIELLVILCINIYYAILDSGGDLELVGVFFSFLLVIHMALTAFIIRLTSRVSQKLFIGLGLSLLGCVLLLVFAGLVFG